MSHLLLKSHTELPASVNITIEKPAAVLSLCSIRLFENSSNVYLETILLEEWPIKVNLSIDRSGLCEFSLVKTQNIAIKELMLNPSNIEINIGQLASKDLNLINLEQCSKKTPKITHSASKTKQKTEPSASRGKLSRLNEMYISFRNRLRISKSRDSKSPSFLEKQTNEIISLVGKNVIMLSDRLEFEHYTTMMDACYNKMHAKINSRTFASVILNTMTMYETQHKIAAAEVAQIKILCEKLL